MDEDEENLMDEDIKKIYRRRERCLSRSTGNSNKVERLQDVDESGLQLEAQW